jgi:hypothetical protein
MILCKRIVIAALTFAPAVAMATPAAGKAGTFYTTGGRTKLAMTTLSITPTSMKVRLTDATKLAFARRSTTVTLYRSTTAPASGWAAYEAEATKSHPGIDMTIEHKALAGGHGLVGMNLTAWDPLLGGPLDYGMHFQLAGRGLK